MATWKKVVVSGSNISQLNNDAGYLTNATLPSNVNSFATMSVNGVSVAADSSVDTLTFASSSGAGLNIVGNSGTDTISFELGNIPGSSLNTTSVANAISGSIYSGVSGDITITTAGVATIAANSVALGTDTVGNYVASVANGTGITAIAAASEGAAVTVSVSGASTLNTNRITKWTGTAFADSSLTDDGTSITGTTSIRLSGTTSSLTGSFTGSFAGALTGTFPYASLTGIPSGIVSASVLSSPAQGQALLTTNGVAGSTIDLGLEAGDTPTFTGISANGSTFNLVNTTATTVNFAGAGTTINIGASTGTTTINNNLSVLGTLYVQGSVTAISSSNLYVADQFILLASGSATNTDGGIVIDRGSDTAGNIAFGYDSITRRWGYQTGLIDTTNAIDPTSASGVSGSFAGIIFTEASHGATKPTTGEFAVLGATYIASNEDIWIYS